MVENGYVTREEGEKAKAEPLGVKPRRAGTYLFAGEYFAEEVRREIIARYGEDALYEGGLSVRTTLDPKLQLMARKALQNGLIKFDTLRGYRGPVATIDIARRLGRAAGRGQGRSTTCRNGGLPWCSTAPTRRPDDRPAAEARVCGQGRRRIARRARSPWKT